VQPRRPLLFGCAASILAVPVLPMFAVAAPVPAIAAVVFLGSLGIELYGTLWDTTLQERVPRDRLSRVSSYDHFGSLVAVPIGLSAVGPIADDIGVDQTLWAGSALLLVATLGTLAVREVREVRRMPVAA
jgi:predicted MFS family arabinose efflux permease